MPKVGLLAVPFFLFACIEHATPEQLKTRASFDMDCPKSEIKYVDLDDKTRGVSGCGQHTTYVEVCSQDSGGQTCTWVLNTDAKARRKSDDN
jgi:hypothetical protein